MATNDTSGMISGQELYRGLLTADASIVAGVWAEYRSVVERAITAMGGSLADARVFFQAAIVEIARLYRDGLIDDDTPAGPALVQMADAHYRNWLQERGQPVPEKGEVPIDSVVDSPAQQALLQTQRSIFVWKQLKRIPERGRLILLGALGEQWDDRSIAAATGSDPSQIGAEKASFFKAFRQLLQLSDEDTDWPSWVVIALGDKQGWALWQVLDVPDPGDKPAVPNQRRQTWMWLYLAISLLIMTYAALQYWMDGHTSEAVFADHFDPPTSLWSADAPGPGAATLEPCAELLQEADYHYQRKDYREAIMPLREAVESPDGHCRSKACFYLGVSLLELGDPAGALEYFAKIEDLEQYGEEIYWYQALCFVKLSESYPPLREKAVRAVERFITQSRDEHRRRLAEQMLKELSK